MSMNDPQRWNEIEGEIADALKDKLAIAFLGSASSGKDSAIRALFGVDFGEISPIPGSTSEVRMATLDGDGRFVVVNAPGFGDIRKNVDESGRKILEELDIVIYVVNAEGGATIDEKKDLELIRARHEGKGPTLVCLNKIDLIRLHQRQEFIDKTLAQLGVDPRDAVACAFDPHPALADEPIAIQAVIDWIGAQLEEKGKTLLFARWLRDRRAACQPLINAAAKKAAIAGAVPIPGADMTVVTWIQVKLVEQIAAVHGQKLDQQIVLWMVGELLAGGTRGFVRWAVQAAKVAGWIPGGQLAEVAASSVSAAIASATTFGVGEAAIRYMQSEKKLDISQLKEIFDKAALTRAGVKEIEASE